MSLLVLFLAACSVGLEPGTILIVPVNPDGDAVEATRVGWFDPTSPPFPVDAATDVECAPDCVLSGDLPDRVHVVASLAQPDREAPAPQGETCVFWDSTFTVVHTSDDVGQRVHLVLDPERVWCDDGIDLGYTEPWRPPSVSDDDVRALPEAPSTRFVVAASDLAGDALPLAGSSWYFHPESAEYDGEHPLACLDALCTEWGLPEGEGPEGGEIYVNGTYIGPFHILGDASYGDYQGAPVDLTDGPDRVALAFDTTLAQIE